MFNISVGMDYVLPPPPVAADIPAVASVPAQRKPRREKDRKREDRNRKKPAFRELLEKEAKEEFGQMGCFFETTA